MGDEGGRLKLDQTEVVEWHGVHVTFLREIHVVYCRNLMIEMIHICK